MGESSAACTIDVHLAARKTFSKDMIDSFRKSLRLNNSNKPYIVTLNRLSRWFWFGF